MKIHGIARIVFLIVSLSFPAATIVAQLSTDDSTFYRKAINNSIAAYYNSTGDQSRLYNGTQYPGYPFTFKEGIPFFYSDKPDMGSIVYDGLLYENVLLQYDELGGMVVMQDRAHHILFRNELVSQFSIFNNTFIRIVKDSASRVLYETGYYNLLYHGKTIQVLGKEVKKVREQIQSSAEGIWRLIDTKNYFYIRKDNNYYEVEGKKGLLRVYADHKKELQQFIKSNKLSFRKNPEDMLVKASEYYDRLIK